ncbi:hypothetical protein NIES2130_14930 [Scytonema sp. HK-05]|nr:hypothetical protein NIES2130_14930 [Scytonema sp. HK-05]
MLSPWQIPLPLEEYTATRVVVYFFFDGRWIPIKFCTLNKAIKLCYEALLSNREIFLFPVDMDPNDFDTPHSK